MPDNENRAQEHTQGLGGEGPIKRTLWTRPTRLHRAYASPFAE